MFKKPVVLLILVGAVLAGIWFLYFKPDAWNPIARGYLNRAELAERQVDTLRRDTARLREYNRKKDFAIKVLTDEAREANKLGDDWKKRYQDEVAISDATSDQLTDREREVAYFHGLVANGTLKQVAPADFKTLTPNRPDVVRAGLQTADREKIQAATLANVAKTIGSIQAANNRLRAGPKVAARGLDSMGVVTVQKVRGGLWPFNRRRRREHKETVEGLKKVGQDVNEVSEIEAILNQ